MLIDFLAIGHLTHDRTPDGFRLGGTVSYAAVTAKRLGWHPGILTRASLQGFTRSGAPGLAINAIAEAGSALEGIAIHLLPAPVSTTFNNIYHDGQRTQVIEALAAPIEPGELPPAWAAVPVVLLGPLARELPASWADAFPSALMAVTPQGWMRQWDADGRVSAGPWVSAPSFLRRANVVILSREDVGNDESRIQEMMRQAQMMVVTDGWHGASLYRADEVYRVRPRPAKEVDPTGAGDVFATAFLIRLAETHDALAAARFANAVASMSVEAVGMDGIPDRQRVEEWLATA